MATDGQKAQVKAAKTARWAVTMTKVRIRQVTARTRWQLVTFCGKTGAESRGVVDLMAIRKDHRRSPAGMKRGDAIEIILIQVKGGSASRPTDEDGKRLNAVAKLLKARFVLLATWKKGSQTKFFQWPKASQEWTEISDLQKVFR
jgi:hypothetical protein